MFANEQLLNLAHQYSEEHSTCAKVHVGSVIETIDGTYIFGCNHGVMNCKQNGCRRVRLYGENSKIHRLPSDCDALHSEIDAICEAAKKGVSIDGATIYITRYPCEACARAIAVSGIKKVVYGRNESISEYTKSILLTADVDIEKADWTEEDDNE